MTTLTTDNWISAISAGASVLIVLAAFWIPRRERQKDTAQRRAESAQRSLQVRAILRSEMETVYKSANSINDDVQNWGRTQNHFLPFMGGMARISFPPFLSNIDSWAQTIEPETAALLSVALRRMDSFNRLVDHYQGKGGYSYKMQGLDWSQLQEHVEQVATTAKLALEKLEQ